MKGVAVSSDPPLVDEPSLGFAALLKGRYLDDVCIGEEEDTQKKVGGCVTIRGWVCTISCSFFDHT